MFFSKKGSKETYPLRPPPLLEPPLELPRDDDLENPEDLLLDLELVLLVLEEFPEDLVLVDLLLEGLVVDEPLLLDVVVLLLLFTEGLDPVVLLAVEVPLPALLVPLPTLLVPLPALPVLLPVLLVPRVLAVPLFLEYVVLVLEDVLLAEFELDLNLDLEFATVLAAEVLRDLLTAFLRPLKAIAFPP